MNGVAALLQVLGADAALTALVPAARIMAGILPLDTALPAISVTLVSSVDRKVISAGALRHVRQRVQATVLASGYPEQQAVMAAMRRAAADSFPTVPGISRVTIHTESTGPDFMDRPAALYAGSQDFRVTYSEDR